MAEINWKEQMPKIATGLTVLASSWWLRKWMKDNSANAEEETPITEVAEP